MTNLNVILKGEVTNIILLIHIIHVTHKADGFLCNKSSVHIKPTSATEKPRPRIPGELYPRMIIFSMDNNIWPFSIALDVTPPVKKNVSEVVLDDGNQQLKPFPHVSEMLQTLQDKGYKLVFINQSPDNKTVDKLLDFFNFNKFLTYKITTHAPKREIITRISQDYKIHLSDILFLDSDKDEMTDIAEEHVTCILTGKEGATMADVQKGLQIFSTSAPTCT